MRIGILLTVLMTLSFSDKELFPQEQRGNVISAKRLILIIDFAFINCPLCIQSLTDFNNMINAFKLEDSFIGVLVYREKNDEVDTERRIKIIETQLRGFIKGNDIRYPIILDKKGIFKCLSLDEASLILLDIQRKTVKKYTFPLKKGQIDEIFFKVNRKEKEEEEISYKKRISLIQKETEESERIPGIYEDLDCGNVRLIE